MELPNSSRVSGANGTYIQQYNEQCYVYYGILAGDKLSCTVYPGLNE